MARRLGVSRARVTQLLGLLKLPAEVRDEVLHLPAEQRRHFSERGLRAIARMPSPARQVGGSTTPEFKTLDLMPGAAAEAGCRS